MKSDLFIKLLEEKTTLSSTFIEALELRLQLELYKPHQVVNAAGHIENRLYFIESGFVRSYFYDQHGQQHIVRFWDKGSILFSYEGYFKVPSHCYIEIMAESRMITLSYANLFSGNVPADQILLVAIPGRRISETTAHFVAHGRPIQLYPEKLQFLILQSFF